MYINHNVTFINNTKNKDMFFCNICEYVLITLEDFKANKTFDCCHECYLNFVESRREAWITGWRPDKTVIKEYINLRKDINNKIVNIAEE